MADKNFEVRKGLTVANTVIVTSGSNVGISNTAPDATLAVTGTANVSGNVAVAGTLTIAGLKANSSLGSAGQLLYSNGSIAYWANTPTIATPGANTQILFNDSGSSNASAGLVFDKSSNTLIVSNIVNAASHTVGSSVVANATGVWTTGTVNAAVHSVGTSVVANATGVWTTGTVNAAVHSVGTTFVANGTTVFVGNATVNAVMTSDTLRIGNATVGMTFASNGNMGIGGNNAPTVDLYVNGAAAGAIGTLTDGANVAVDLAAYNNYSLTLNGNRNIDNPTGLVAGQSGVIFLSQNASGGQVPTWGSYWKFPSNTAPTLSTSASAVDAVVYVVRTTTSITAQAILNVG